MSEMLTTIENRQAASHSLCFFGIDANHKKAGFHCLTCKKLDFVTPLALRFGGNCGEGITCANKLRAAVIDSTSSKCERAKVSDMLTTIGNRQATFHFLCLSRLRQACIASPTSTDNMLRLRCTLWRCALVTIVGKGTHAQAS